MKRTVIILMLALCCIGSQARKKPLIGITCTWTSGSNKQSTTYTDAIMKAGGIPVLIPAVTDEASAMETMKSLDGILFSGGPDYDPAYYGEKPIPELGEVAAHRDTSDFALAAAAMKLKKPILGICRGEQLMGIVTGGKLYQDIPTQHPSEIVHRQDVSSSIPTHMIRIEKGSILHDIVGADSVMVNSFHHQGVKETGAGVKVTARADDGIVEAFESTGKGSRILAVQFHPEGLARGNEDWLKLFRTFVSWCR